jgi:hypothetical protein
MSAPLPALPPGKFRVLYADPPWQYDFSATDSRAIEAFLSGDHYPGKFLQKGGRLERPQGREGDLPGGAPVRFVLWWDGEGLRKGGGAPLQTGNGALVAGRDGLPDRPTLHRWRARLKPKACMAKQPYQVCENWASTRGSSPRRWRRP